MADKDNKDKEGDHPPPPQPIRTEPETRRKDLEEGRPPIKIDTERKKGRDES